MKLRLLALQDYKFSFQCNNLNFWFKLSDTIKEVKTKMAPQLERNPYENMDASRNETTAAITNETNMVII